MSKEVFNLETNPKFYIWKFRPAEWCVILLLTVVPLYVPPIPSSSKREKENVINDKKQFSKGIKEDRGYCYFGME